MHCFSLFLLLFLLNFQSIESVNKLYFTKYLHSPEDIVRAARFNPNAEKILIENVNLDYMPRLEFANNLNSIIIDSTNLKSLNGTNFFPHSLKTLKVRKSQVKYIHPDCFSKLTRLVLLDIAKNGLVELELNLNLIIENFFNFNINDQPLNKFKKLSLNASLSPNFTGSLNKPTIEIYITHTEMRSFPVLINPNNITFKIRGGLDMGEYYNQFDFIFLNNQYSGSLQGEGLRPHDMEKIRNLPNKYSWGLQNLRLIYTPMMAHLDGMYDLDLSNNKIRYLDNPNTLPKKIEILRYENNLIEYISQGFFEKSNFLRKVYLTKNKIKNLQKLIFYSNYFELIDLSENKISNLENIWFRTDKEAF